MRTFQKIADVRAYVRQARAKKLRIGFVPTMGAFHKGHCALMQAARKDADVVIVSIFVNPLQFASGEDYDRYPRQPELDRKIAEAEGVDALFLPTVAEMYPKGHDTYVDQTHLPKFLCGPFRPGHFRGVMTVVAKLLNIVQPDFAVFGQKDFQQYLIIRRMVADLNLDTKIVLHPTVREEDGLAMSSRNMMLGPKQRVEALCLIRALERGKELIEKGESDAAKVAKEVRKIMDRCRSVRVEYAAVVNPETLEPIREIKGKILLAAAARIGKTRLIDNLLVG